MQELILNPGDCVYYSDHNALGILLERLPPLQGDRDHRWAYSLRSPLENHRDMIVTNIHTTSEDKLIKFINEGHLAYYAKI